MDELYKYPTLRSLPKHTPWEVPEDYFATFPEKIKIRLALETTEEDENVDTAPDGYFEALPEQIQSKIAAELAPTLFLLPKPDTQAALTDYFEGFAAKIQQKIEHEEMQQLAPVLASIEKVQTIESPQGYFEALPQKIQEKISTAEPKILVFKHLQRITYGLISVAAIALLVWGMFLYRPTTTESLTFDDISDEELIEAVNVDEIDVTTLANILEYDKKLENQALPSIKDVTDEELIEYINRESFEM